jgi:hypothetical protein
MSLQLLEKRKREAFNEDQTQLITSIKEDSKGYLKLQRTTRFIPS